MSLWTYSYFRLRNPVQHILTKFFIFYTLCNIIIHDSCYCRTLKTLTLVDLETRLLPQFTHRHLN